MFPNRALNSTHFQLDHGILDEDQPLRSIFAEQVYPCIHQPTAMTNSSLPLLEVKSVDPSPTFAHDSPHLPHINIQSNLDNHLNEAVIHPMVSSASSIVQSTVQMINAHDIYGAPCTQGPFENTIINSSSTSALQPSYQFFQETLFDPTSSSTFVSSSLSSNTIDTPYFGHIVKTSLSNANAIIHNASIPNTSLHNASSISNHSAMIHNPDVSSFTPMSLHNVISGPSFQFAFTENGSSMENLPLSNQINAWVSQAASSIACDTSLEPFLSVFSPQNSVDMHDFDNQLEDQASHCLSLEPFDSKSPHLGEERTAALGDLEKDTVSPSLSSHPNASPLIRTDSVAGVDDIQGETIDLRVVTTSVLHRKRRHGSFDSGEESCIDPRHTTSSKYSNNNFAKPLFNHKAKSSFVARNPNRFENSNKVLDKKLSTHSFNCTKKIDEKKKYKKKYMCQYDGCTKSFRTSSERKRHVNVHLNSRPFRCSFPSCDKSFNQKVHLQRHEVKHTRDTPFKCERPHCGEEFSTSFLLRSHKQEHVGEYVCNFPGCGKSMRKYALFRHHKRLHDDSLYECRFEKCSQRFATDVKRKEHELMHKIPHNFYCDYKGCKRSFTMAESLVKHKRLFHEEKEIDSNPDSLHNLKTSNEKQAKLIDTQRQHLHDVYKEIEILKQQLKAQADSPAYNHETINHNQVMETLTLGVSQK